MNKTVQTPARMDQRRQFSQYAVSCILVFLLSVVCPLFLPQYCQAEETETVITSDSLEYFSETKQYVAKGSVEIKQKDAVLTADEVIYFEATSDVIAVGKVQYNDAETSMKAQKAEMNFEKKTGRVFDANIFFEKKDKIAEGGEPEIRAGRKTYLDISSIKDHFYLSGEEIEKRGENSYYSPSASFTACDAPIPAWCFRGRNVTLKEDLKANDASFRIKNVPVLYTPYLWVPILETRKTGLLMPTISQSELLGVGLRIPFFWAISENRDATLVLDSYSKRGIGGGVEYRFIEPGGAKGYAWVYHIKDTELDKNFWELKGLYENRPADAPGGFLNVNFLNEEDFYRTFSTQLETRTQRFLESTGEFNYPLKNSRLYMLAQYWVDLKQEAADVPQKLPEAGYVLNYTKMGSSLVSGSLTAANFWRDGGLSAGRIDLYPKILYSFGRDFVVSQKAAVRATAYSFYNDGAESNIQRTAFEYDVVGHTRLYRKYASFLHVIEPSVRYHLITSSENDLPVLDASELFGKASVFELSLLNRIITGGTEVATVRLTQGMDTYNGDRPFLPLSLELAINKGAPIKLNATYNLYTGMVETLSSDLSLNVFKTNLALGHRYNRIEDIMLFTAALEFSPFKRVRLGSNIWYDAKGGGVRDFYIAMRYQRQCWGLRFEVIKKPGDYSMLLMFDLTGISGESSKNN
jgi:LPS-assembly protein